MLKKLFHSSGKDEKTKRKGREKERGSDKDSDTDRDRHREQYNKQQSDTHTSTPNPPYDNMTLNTGSDGKSSGMEAPPTPAHGAVIPLSYESEQEVIADEYLSEWRDKDQYLLQGKGMNGVVDYIEYCCIRLLHSNTLRRLQAHDKPFTVVDYGCSQGQNSLPIVHTLLQHIKETKLLEQSTSRGHEHDDKNGTDICIVHEDALGNSFDTLFDLIDGINQPNGDGEKQEGSLSAMQKRYGVDWGNSNNSQVYTLASATSFFESVMPSRSVTFGVTVACWHWLSKLPCNLSNTFHSIYSEGEEREKWAEVAAHDWYTLLSHRSRELGYGGILLISLYCVDKNNRAGGFEKTHQAIDMVLESMGREKILTTDELDASSCPMYYRNEDEYLNSELLSSLDLNVLHHEQQQLANPIYEAYKDDANEFAKRHTEWCRSWSSSTFYNAFTGDETEKQRKIDTLYERLETYIREHVREFDGQPLVAYIILQKNIPHYLDQQVALVGAQQGAAASSIDHHATPIGAAAVGAGAGSAVLSGVQSSFYDKPERKGGAMNGYDSTLDKVSEHQQHARQAEREGAAARDTTSGGSAIAANDNRNDEQQQYPPAHPQQPPSSTAPLPPVQARQVSDDELEYQLSDIMNVVLDACLRAGEELEDGYFSKRKSITEVKLTKKRCEQVLVECLLHAFSACRILASDSDQTDISEHLTFLIDAVGGAYNFLHDSPFCSVSVGVLANRQLIAGVVHAPIMNTTYHAVLGQGSFVSNFRLLRDGEQQGSGQQGAGSYTIAGYTQVSKHRIKVSKVTELHDALIRTELIQTENDDDLQQTLQNLYALLSNQSQAIRMIGSIALNLCSAALGSTDVVYQIENPASHGQGHGSAANGKQLKSNIPFACAIAGGVLILKEAGGIVVNSQNQSNDVSHFSLFAGNIIGTPNKELASKMLQVLGSNLADEHLREDDKHGTDGIIHATSAARGGQYVHQAASVGGKHDPSTGDKTLDNILNDNNQRLAAEQGYSTPRQQQQSQTQPSSALSSIWSGWNFGSSDSGTGSSSSREQNGLKKRTTPPALPKSRPPDHLPSYQREYLNRVSPRR